MERIAMLEVYEVEASDTEKEREASSFYQRHDANRKLHRIVLNPIHSCGECGTYDKVTVLAHELGHFVSHMIDSPSATVDEKRNMYHMLLGIDTRIPEEEYAWEIAEKIAEGAKLTLDPERKAKALGSYTGK